MQVTFRVVLLAGVCLVSLSACQTTKQDIAKGVGVVAGVLVGSQFGSGSGQLVASAVGGVAGYFVGDWIGAMLDPEEQAEVQSTSIGALESAEDGEAVTWRNPDDDKQATVKVDGTRRAHTETTVIRKKQVASATQLVLVNQTYRAVSDSNIRLGPSTDYEQADSLRVGNTIHVVGQVRDKDWYMVARDGVSVGYIYAPLVEPAPDAAAARQMAKGDAAPAGKAGKPADLDELITAQDLAATAQQPSMRAPRDLDAMKLSDDLAVDAVTAETECRDLEVQVEASGETASNHGTACRAPDGAWEISGFEDGRRV